MRFISEFTATLAASILAAFIFSAVYAQEGLTNDDEIIVQGQQIPDELTGGEWQFDLSRSYSIGKPLTIDNPLTKRSDPRIVGKDQSWRFCMADSKVETLVRQLSGEGRSTSAGTTVCRPARIRSEKGILRTEHECTGGTIMVSHPDTGEPVSMSARNRLTVTARYSPDAISIDFIDVRQPAAPLIRSSTAPAGVMSEMNPPILPEDRRRWSIKARRIGDCVT